MKKLEVVKARLTKARTYLTRLVSVVFLSLIAQIGVVDITLAAADSVEPVGDFGVQVSLSASRANACVVRSDNTLRCSDYVDIYEPRDYNLSQYSSVKQAAMGSQHICALHLDALVYCWGGNLFKQSGYENAREDKTQGSVPQLSGVKFIAAGATHTCALTAYGNVKCWGDNSAAQLGIGSRDNSGSGAFLVNGVSNISQIAAGGRTTCALKSDPKIFCWGGFGSTSILTITPRSGVLQISVSDSRLCAVLQDKSLQCWTLESVQGIDQASELLLGSLSSASQVAVAPDSTCIVTVDNRAQCWGENGLGQLANGSTDYSMNPSNATVEDVGHVIMSPKQTCFVHIDGSIECSASVGLNLTMRPGVVLGLDNVKGVRVGPYTACAITDERDVRCWGLVGSGYQTTPITIEGLTNANDLGIGNLEVCSLDTLGKVSCWSQLTGITSQVDSVSNATRIVHGVGHACVLEVDSSVTCWGDSGGLGQVIPGGAILRPFSVSGLPAASDLSSGAYFTCAIVQLGKVYCWGQNAEGSLGDGTTNDSSTPVEVKGISGAVAIFTGDRSACAKLQNGDFYCWGSSIEIPENPTERQIGKSYLTPTKFSKLSESVSVSLGGGKGGWCAVKVDNRVFCAGPSLIDLTRGERDTYVGPVSQIDRWAGLTCAVKIDKHIICWGGANDKKMFGKRSLVDVDLSIQTSTSRAFTSLSIEWFSKLASSEVTVDSYEIKYKDVRASDWTASSSVSASSRSATLSHLTPCTYYEISVEPVADGVTLNPTYFDTSTACSNLVSSSSASLSASVVRLSWQVDPSVTDVSDYQISFRRLGDTEWISYADSVSNYAIATISNLAAASVYEFRVTPMAGQYDTQPFYLLSQTKGVGTWEARLVDADGNPVSGGSYAWVSKDGLNRSSNSKIGTSLGAVTFTSVPAKEVLLTVTNAVLADGSKISGEFATWATAGATKLELPAVPKPETKLIKVSLPTGVPIPNALVQAVNLDSTTSIVGENFSGTVTIPSASASSETDKNGIATLTGYSNTGPVSVTATYDDGELYQRTNPVQVSDDVGEIALEYMPILQVEADDFTAELNTLVSIPVSIGDSLGGSTITSSMRSRIMVASYPGVQVTIVPPTGASQKSCKGSTSLSVKTNSNGQGTLKVCASASGEYKIKAKGAVSSGAVTIHVRKSKPMAVQSLEAVSNSKNTIFAAWGDVEFDGASAVTSYIVKAVSGSLAKSITLKQGSAGFTSKSITLTGLDGGRNWTVSVIAVNKYGSGVAASKKLIISGGAIFTATPSPTISGIFSVGKKLVAKPGTWDRRATLSYQWNRDGLPIPGATSPSYTLTMGDKTHQISLSVTGISYGYETVVKTSIAKPAS